MVHDFKTTSLSVKSNRILYNMPIIQKMIDTLCASVIPEGVAWGDYFLNDDDFSIVSTIEPETNVVSDDWEIVGGKTETFQDSLPVRTPRWCKHGNACLWRNCPFRHERCEHYDKWVASRGRTRGCRCQQTDPTNSKRPDEGGCKYDHRDMRELEIYHVSLPCSTMAEIWDSFYDRGLEGHDSNHYDVSGMSRVNRALLVRSLIEHGAEFEDYGNWFRIILSDT